MDHDLSNAIVLVPVVSFFVIVVVGMRLDKFGLQRIVLIVRIRGDFLFRMMVRSRLSLHRHEEQKRLDEEHDGDADAREDWVRASLLNMFCWKRVCSAPEGSPQSRFSGVW